MNYNINKNINNEIDWFGVLVDLARFLRSPEGCPWDRKQTASDFARFAREELDELLTVELQVAEALDSVVS